MEWAVMFDFVEVILAVEDEFGISIPDEESWHIQTFGDLYAYVMDVTNRPDGKGRCFSQRAFYMLRRSLVGCFGIGRSSIKRNTSTETFFPKAQRRKAWERLSKEIGMNIPELKRPVGMVWVIVLLVLICIGGILIIPLGGFFQDDYWVNFNFALVAGFLVPLLLWRVTRQFAVEIPGSCQTTGGLAKVVARKDWGEAFEEGNLDKEVWERLCTALLKCQCIEESHLRPETDFMEIDDQVVDVKLFGDKKG